MRHNTIQKEGGINSYTISYSFAKKRLIEKHSGEIGNKILTPLLSIINSPESLSNSKLILYSPGDDESRLLFNGHNITWAFPSQILNNGGVIK